MQIEIYGKPFTVTDEPADFWGWVNEGRYNLEWKALTDYLRPEHTFIDLGAWVGSHSLFASTIAKRVIAVEPDPIAHDILVGNIEASGKNIETRRVAIGRQGVVTLGSGLLGASTTRANRHGGGGIGAWEPGQQFDIESKTLRQFVYDVAATDPLFLKIDIEGGEEEIVRDVEFFKDHRPTVYLESHPFWWTDERSTTAALNQICSMYRTELKISKYGLVLTDVA